MYRPKTAQILCASFQLIGLCVHSVCSFGWHPVRCTTWLGNLWVFGEQCVRFRFLHGANICMYHRRRFVSTKRTREERELHSGNSRQRGIKKHFQFRSFFARLKSKFAFDFLPSSRGVLNILLNKKRKKIRCHLWCFSRVPLLTGGVVLYFSLNFQPSDRERNRLGTTIDSISPRLIINTLTYFASELFLARFAFWFVWDNFVEP